jgi:hypothetical protein
VGAPKQRLRLIGRRLVGQGRPGRGRRGWQPPEHRCRTADPTLKSGTLDDGFRATLAELWQGLADDGNYDDWTEPNDIKYLFRSGQKWSRSDAQEIVLETWRYLDY